MDSLVQLTTNILRDLKGISDIQQALMFLGGGSGAVVGGALGCTSVEATAAGTAAAGASSTSTALCFAGIGALAGVLIGLGIATSIHAYERKKLQKELKIQEKLRVERIRKNFNRIIEIAKGYNSEFGEQIRAFMLFEQEGIFTDEMFLQKIQQICLKGLNLTHEQVADIKPLPL